MILHQAHLRLAREAPVLLRLGWTCLIVALVLGALLVIDPLLVAGESRWLKPLRFALSLGVYAWTIGLLLTDLQLPRAWRLVVVSVTIAMIGIEQGLITLQAARGVTSHFNEATVFDTIIYRAMGIAISTNAIVVAALLPLGFIYPHPDVPRLRRWGWRLGIVVFMLGCAQAAVMILQHGHTVGAVDALGPSLPLLGWSLDTGDLRVAHFLGIHGLQAMPLLAFVIERGWPNRRPGHGMAVLALATLLYTAVGVFALLAALDGHPVWRLPA